MFPKGTAPPRTSRLASEVLALRHAIPTREVRSLLAPLGANANVDIGACALSATKIRRTPRPRKQRFGASRITTTTVQWSSQSLDAPKCPHKKHASDFPPRVPFPNEKGMITRLNLTAQVPRDAAASRWPMTQRSEICFWARRGSAVPRQETHMQHVHFFMDPGQYWKIKKLTPSASCFQASTHAGD